MSSDSTTRERDKAARGANVINVRPPKIGERCSRCHRGAGRRSGPEFGGLGIPCALCSPILASEVHRAVASGQLILEFT